MTPSMSYATPSKIAAWPTRALNEISSMPSGEFDSVPRKSILPLPWPSSLPARPELVFYALCAASLEWTNEMYLPL